MKRWWLLVFIAICILNAFAETHTGWQTGKGAELRFAGVDNSVNMG